MDGLAGKGGGGFGGGKGGENVLGVEGRCTAGAWKGGREGVVGDSDRAVKREQRSGGAGRDRVGLGHWGV